VVHTVHINTVLLHKDTNGGVDDHRNSHQQGWPTRGEEKNGYTIGIHGDRGPYVMVRVMDAIRRGGPVRCIRPKGIHFTAGFHDSGTVLQGG